MKQPIHKKIVKADLKQARTAQRNHQNHLQNQERMGKEELNTGFTRLAHIGQGCQSSLFLTLLTLNNYLQYHCLAEQIQTTTSSFSGDPSPMNYGAVTTKVEKTQNKSYAPHCFQNGMIFLDPLCPAAQPEPALTTENTIETEMAIDVKRKLQENLKDYILKGRSPSSIEYLSEQDYEKISQLLEMDLFPQGGELDSLFKHVIDFRIIELLIKHGAKPNRDDFVYLRGYWRGDFDKMREPGLSNALKAYEYLSKKITTLDDIVYLSQDMSKTYNQFDELIQKGKADAVKQNKPLLILLGESHQSTESLLMQSLMLQIAMSRYNVRTIMMEVFNDGRYDDIGRWYVASEIRKIIQRFDGKIIEIDVGVKDASSYCQKFSSDEWFKCRNVKMCEAATSHRENLAVNENIVIGIVGAEHLFGLIKETSLSNVYYIVPVNVGIQPEHDKKSMKELSYIFSQEVIQAVLEKQVYFTPQMAQQLSEATFQCESLESDEADCEKMIARMFRA